MKKFMFMLMVLVILGLNTQVSALTVAGTFNGWDPAAGDVMTDNLDGTHSITLSGFAAGERHTFKVTDGTWGWSYPVSGNSWFYADSSGDISISFDTNVVSDGWLPQQYRIGLNNDPATWSIVGDLNGWNNADPAWAMTPQGGGIYKLTQTLSPGTYWWKATVTGTWDAIGGDGRSENADAIGVTTTPGNEVVNFYVDAINGTYQVVPEPTTMVLLGLGSLGILRRKK